MQNKKISSKMKKQRLWFLCVVVCFLLCGIWYSHSVYQGEIKLGRAITAEEFAKPVRISENGGKININTALEAELMLISGIGEKRAADIIGYREANGNFQNIEQIMNVSGIGEKTFAQIKEEITVGE